ncbi:MAG TPA: cytochrome c oxidase subunit II [Steroidobacteraceae bacterium]|jgi:cytochrome c oxidase subunit 2|nr:cytochrome c oxidase subunit II [Steroidobacteraceae bacterium]
MKNRHARRGLQAAAFPLFALLASVAHADWGGLNMPEGVTVLSKKIYSLHMLILWVCVILAVVVFGVMIYSIIKFRKSQGAQPDKTLVHSTKVEIVWTVIPIAILVFMAVPIARTLIEIEDMGDVNLNIKVTGYQWKWEYEYLGQNVSFFSTLKRDSNAARQLGSGIDPKSVEHYLLDVDNHLVVPAGQKIRFLLTAQDVIHAWWVPAFGMKKDAIPGYVNEIWVQVDADKVGTYRGQCAELCGRDHGFMPIVVDVLSPADFDKWLREKQAEKKLADVAPDAPAVTASTAPATLAQ